MQNITVVDSQGQEVPSESRDINSAPTGAIVPDGEIARTAAAHVLGVKADEMAENKEKLTTVVLWAKEQTDDYSVTNLKWVIKNLEMKLGTPDFGETRLTKVARFAHLDLEGRRIEQEKQRLYGI